MAEPVLQTAAAGVSIVTLASAVAGPLLGPYLVIVLGAISGGLWALSGTAATVTRVDGALLMLRCVLTAVLLTAIIAQVLAARFGIATTELYCLVSLSIGAMGNRWQDVLDGMRDRLRLLVTRAPDQAGGGGDK